MSRSLSVAFSALVAACTLSMTIEAGHALRGRCGRKGCPPSSQAPSQPAPSKPGSTKPAPTKPVPTKPVKNPSQPVNVGPLPLPNFWGQNPNGRPVLMCDARAHAEAIIKFQAKIAAARARIKKGILQGTSQPLSQCSSIPGFLKKTCCSAVKSVAVKKCRENVEQESLLDTECTFRPVNCRLFPRPIQCIKAKKTEEIRSQCCSWLAPQGKADLLAYCDIAAQEVQDQSGSCTLAEAPTPPTDTPIVSLPSPSPSPSASPSPSLSPSPSPSPEPVYTTPVEPVVTTPVEPVITVIPQEPPQNLPDLITE